MSPVYYVDQAVVKLLEALEAKRKQKYLNNPEKNGE